MKTAKNRKGCIDNPNLTYEAEPREVKLRKIISGEALTAAIASACTEDAMDKINQSTASQIAKNKGETESAKNFGTEEKTDPERS